MINSPETAYSSSEENVRSSFGGDIFLARGFYQPLCEFVQALEPPTSTKRLLDVGCGVGWSTFIFAEAGYDAVGIDLNPSAFEPPHRQNCALRYGSATDIPFEPDSFDIVVCYQCLEHLPTPQLALDEMIRVCRSSGVIAIVGPNLVNPLLALSALHPSRLKRQKLVRRPGMPRHPYGNTLPETLGVAVLRTLQLIPKFVRRSPRFLMREPDKTPPFHGDNDACYLCNPADIIAYLKQAGLNIEKRAKPGRRSLTYLFDGGTWVGARKP